MSKWSDFVILDAVKDYRGTRIEKVYCCEDHGDKLGSGYWYSREYVITQIKRGWKYCTAIKNNYGTYRKGADVFVIEIHGEEFLKTRADGTKKDNLEFFAESAVEL